MGEFVKDRLPDAEAYHDSIGEPLTGTGAWGTRGCPFHGGSDSLRVLRSTGGFCCMACGEKGGDVLAFHMRLHGLEFIPAAKELGAWVEDDKPYRGPTRARRLPASDALQLLYFDSLLVWTAACNVANGVALTDKDRSDVADVVNRLYLVTQESAA